MPLATLGVRPALGGAAGIAVAWWGIRLLATLDPARVLGGQRLSGLGAVTFSSLQLDGTTLAFAAALALATGFVFGLVPALQATQPALTEALTIGNAQGTRRGGLSSRPGGVPGDDPLVGVHWATPSWFETTRVLGSLLYGVTPFDPATFAAIVALLAGAVLMACWIPVRRASCIDPAAALRGG